MIPKIIHLCWLSGDAYPAKIARCIESWKKFLPDYDIMLWDTNRFDLSKSQWVRDAFENKKYAFAADYIRFYALYHYGGVYLDSDVEVLRSFNDLLDLPYFVGAEKAQTPEAAIIGAEKGCDWIKQCLDYYDGRPFVKDDGSLDIRKLPEIMVEEIEKLITEKVDNGHQPLITNISTNKGELDENGKNNLAELLELSPNDYWLNFIKHKISE